MKLLILGARGMLGHDLAAELSEYKPILWDKENLDLTDRESVLESILKLSPEVIVNAAAYTDVEGAEQNEVTANLINNKVVGYLAQAAKLSTAKLFHISTEYVFSGEKESGYDEDDKPEPLSAYGRSKFKGEGQLIRSGCDYYLLRTSWLYGKAPQAGKPRGKNFIETIIDKAAAGEELKVVDDQYGRPTYSRDFARQLKYFFENDLPNGIYHIVNEGMTTWFGLAELALRLRGLNAKIRPCSSTEYPSKAKRPRYSILNNNKLPKLRTWQDALRGYLTN